MKPQLISCLPRFRCASFSTSLPLLVEAVFGGGAGGGGGERRLGRRKVKRKVARRRRRWWWCGQIKPITHPKTSSPPRVSAGTPINASATPGETSNFEVVTRLTWRILFPGEGKTTRVVVVVVVVSRDVPDLPLLRASILLRGFPPAPPSSPFLPLTQLINEGEDQRTLVFGE